MGLSEFANIELGEAFFELINRMVVKDGIPYSKIGNFDFVSNSWRNLADKPDKTQEEITQLDDEYKTELFDLADSCLLFMGKKTGNKTYQLSFEDFKQFLGLYSINKEQEANNPVEYLKSIKTQFSKIANHGQPSGDNLIDNKDWAAFIYVLDMASEHNENKEFTGFTLSGKITPLNYAVTLKELRTDEDNLVSFKLRQAYKNLFS